MNIQKKCGSTVGGVNAVLAGFKRAGVDWKNSIWRRTELKRMN